MTITLEEALAELRKARKLVLTAHQNPDGDAIGSLLGLGHMLQALGKDILLLLDDDVPTRYDVLPGHELIQKPEEGKTYQADLLVVLDASLDRIGAVRDAVQAATLNIDHHPTNGGAADFLYLDGQRAATAEIIYQLWELSGVELTLPLAMALYTGIATDTGFFKFSNTSPFTMRSAARLLEAGVEPNIISEAMEIRPYSHVKGLADALQHVELWHEGRAAGVFLSYEQMQEIEATDSLIDMLRVIEGVEIAAVLKYKEEGKARVSMRSIGIDVSAIATQFGGGGHKRAAGCGIEKPYDEARQELKAAIDAALAPTDKVDEAQAALREAAGAGDPTQPSAAIGAAAQ